MLKYMICYEIGNLINQQSNTQTSPPSPTHTHTHTNTKDTFFISFLTLFLFFLQHIPIVNTIVLKCLSFKQFLENSFQVPLLCEREMGGCEEKGGEEMCQIRQMKQKERNGRRDEEKRGKREIKTTFKYMKEIQDYKYNKTNTDKCFII